MDVLASSTAITDNDDCALRKSSCIYLSSMFGRRKRRSVLLLKSQSLATRWVIKAALLHTMQGRVADTASSRVHRLQLPPTGSSFFNKVKTLNLSPPPSFNDTLHPANDMATRVHLLYVLPLLPVKTNTPDFVCTNTTLCAVRLHLRRRPSQP